ncbi:MAG TPA: hypothetical protein VHC70_01330, partial [Phycisphaerales bacterium]|nr:hypothetical protein [Phycisphaerales bacterium]
MRLIRSKVFRAIPELDRFSDDQCRRFVSAANSSWRRRLLRWIIVGLAGLIGAIGACALIVPTNLWIQNLLRVDDLGGAIIALIVGSLAFALGLLPTLILRDSLLRLTIRRLIRRCGACPRCHYSLLGMRIAGDHSIICPECGLKIDVDASLGELTTDAEGAAVYKPEIVREHEVMKQRRRRRHKRFFQGVAAAVALFLLSATGWWLWLVNQAHRAARDRTAVQQIHQVQLGMWPAAAAANAAAEFERYQALIKACADAQGATNVPGLTQAPVAAYFEASTLIPGADSKAFDKQNGEGSFDACRKFTLAVLRQSRESGLTRDLRSLLDMQGPIRPMAPEGDEPFVSVLIPDLGHARAAARFNGARMIDALQSGDRAEYMEALEENLAIARIVERQGLLIDRLVAIAIDSLTMHRITEDAPKFP